MIRRCFPPVIVIAGVGLAQASVALGLVGHVYALIALVGLAGIIELLRTAAGTQAKRG